MLLQMLWQHWIQALKWRVLYFARTRKGEAAHTVLVQDIPGTAQGTIIGRLNDVRPLLDTKDAVCVRKPLARGHPAVAHCNVPCTSANLHIGSGTITQYLYVQCQPWNAPQTVFFEDEGMSCV